MITAVDTSILLDVLLEDPAFAASSEEALRRTSAEGGQVICEVVYAELAGLFPDHSSLETFLREAGIRIVPSRMKTLWKAGELWRRFCLGRKKMKGDKDFYHSTFADLKVV